MPETNETAGGQLYCLVYTPLGAMNALHYAAAHRGRYGRVRFYVISTNEKNLRQIEDVLAQSDLPQPERTPICLYRYRSGWRKWLNYPALLRCRFRLTRLSRSVGVTDDVLVSHLDNDYSRTLITGLNAAKKVIVVDDGTANFAEFMTVQEKGFLPERALLNSKKNLNTVFLSVCFSRRAIEAQRLIFYSVFPLQALCPYPLRSEVMPRDDKVALFHGEKNEQSNIVYFIGQPVVRRAGVALHDYQAMMQHICDYYARKNLRLTYIPHRNEDASAYDFDADILLLDEPFELYAARLPYQCLNVSGFCSSCVLTTFYMMRESISVELFWGFEAFSPERWQMVQGVIPLFEYEAARHEHFVINRTLTIMVKESAL